MITQGRLQEVLSYEADLGIFLRRKSGAGRPKGIEAGWVDDDGYIRIGIDGQRYSAHRLAILYTDGYLPEHEVDHINRIRTDNRRVNLREASRQCQCRNSGVRKDNTSGVKGVHWDSRTGKWMTQVAVNGKTKTIGYHDTILDAAYTRYAAEQCLGFPDCDINSSAKKYIDSQTT